MRATSLGLMLAQPPSIMRSQTRQHFESLPAGAFVLATVNTNGCPTGYIITSTAAQCLQAANAVGIPVTRVISETSSTFPKGCYKWTTSVYFNIHATGAPQIASTPICVVATLGALQAYLPIAVCCPRRDRIDGRSPPQCVVS